MHWLSYDIEIDGRNTFIVIVNLNYLAYVEKPTPKHRCFYVLTKQTY
jgi:hypothetical protein